MSRHVLLFAIQALSVETAGRIGYRPPLDWDALFGFLAARAIPGVEEVRTGCYPRTLLHQGRPALLEGGRGG